MIANALFWGKTVAFDIATGCFCLFAAWTIHRARMRQAAKSMAGRFEERLAEQTRLARDLHDALLQTIQGSKLVAENALETPMDPVRLRRALEQVAQWLQQAGEEARAALNALRLSNASANDLAEAFKRVLETTSLPSLVSTIAVSGENREIHPLVRDEIYRVGYEAMMNAITHSGAHYLRIELRYSNDLLLRVADDGVRVDATPLGDGEAGPYALQRMRERASRIGARLTVVSDSIRGTDLSLFVPGEVAFLPSEDQESC